MNDPTTATRPSQHEHRETNPDITRKLVGVSNFLWGGDKLMWGDDGAFDDKAAKMIQKGRALLQSVTTREGEMDSDALAEYESIKREVTHRLFMLEERRKSFPLLTPSPTTLRDVWGVIRWETNSYSEHNKYWYDDGGSAVMRKKMQLEVALFARCDVFCDELGIPRDEEIDDLEASATHLVGMLGNAIVGGARFWFHAAMNAVIVDRLFVGPKYRGRRLYRRMLKKIAEETGASSSSAAGKRLAVLVRTNHERCEAFGRDCLAAIDRFTLVPPSPDIPPTKAKLYYATSDEFMFHI